MAGREQKAREGKWNGGFAPYGYKLENGNLVIAEDEVEVIRVMEAANPDANIIFGAAFDDQLEDEMRVTVIATGFDDKKNQQPQQPATKIGAYSAASEKAKSAAVEDIDDIDEIFKIFNKD